VLGLEFVHVAWNTTEELLIGLLFGIDESGDGEDIFTQRSMILVRLTAASSSKITFELKSSLVDDPDSVQDVCFADYVDYVSVEESPRQQYFTLPIPAW
jgi:hypothetical protein